MKLPETSHCPNCQQLTERIAKLEEKLLEAMERISRLEEENARLKQQLAAARKDSSTSSKPPSSDIVKPKNPPVKGGKKRKKGGQPGHEQHLRKPFPPKAVNHFEPHTLDCCPDGGGRLVLSRCEPEVLQQVEITETPIVVTEHRGLGDWCPHCRKVHYAPIPEAVVKSDIAIAEFKPPRTRCGRGFTGWPPASSLSPPREASPVFTLSVSRSSGCPRH